MLPLDFSSLQREGKDTVTIYFCSDNLATERLHALKGWDYY